MKKTQTTETIPRPPIIVIMGHIDHGKSTLADRFLELTGTIEKRKMREQFLDTMDIERERGITIKMQPVRMEWKDFALNLIDTPGHVDFTYEVSRALAAVEGVILLVDATKGVQAQTLAHVKIAIGQGLAIVPAINKIDLPAGMADEAEREIEDLLLSFDYVADKIFRISAKTGDGIDDLREYVLKQVVSRSNHVTIRTHAGNGEALAFLDRHATILDRRYCDEADACVTEIDVRISPAKLNQLRHRIDGIEIVSPRPQRPSPESDV